VDLVAYSSVLGPFADFWSLDQMGPLGINIGYKNPRYLEYTWQCGPDGNDMNYNCHFSGTSAACPVVAGVASSLISRDSLLTVDQVYEILKKSAVRELHWAEGVPIDTPHVEYGYGRVDAFRAVLSIVHGDVNNDTRINLGDLTDLVSYVYMDGAEPFPSILLGDCSCNGKVNLADITYLIAYLYLAGVPPVKPCFEFGAIR
jgi:hypothetical protein